MHWKDRFWSKVDKSGECWEWTASKTHNGYGQFGIWPKRGLRAHRVSYELCVGDIQPGMMVMHRCDNRSCVNPDHLFIGTAKDNTDDMIAKKRMPIGSRKKQAKLTEEDVRKIKAARVSGARTGDLARAYCVTPATICQIFSGRTWRHVD